MNTLIKLSALKTVFRHLIRIGLILSISFVLMGCQEAVEKKPLNNQNVVPAETENRLKAIYEQGEFRAKSFRARWNSNGSSYVVLENTPERNEQEFQTHKRSTWCPRQREHRFHLGRVGKN